MDRLSKKLKDPLIKPHGFPHEHFVVLPGAALRRAERNPLLAGLHATDAGFFPVAAGHAVERPAGAPTHLLVACLRGRGWVRGGSDDKPRAVGAGDMLWLPADNPHAYGADRLRPWTIAYAHFKGGEALAWMRHAGWRGGGVEAVSLGPGGTAALRLDRVYTILEDGHDESRQIEAASALRHALAVLARLARETTRVRPTVERVELVRLRLRQEFARPHRLDELAATAGLSVPRFAQLFRALTGCSAIEYLRTLRIQRACQLLATSESAIGEIAAEVGYADAFFFTRSFTATMGCPPREYRALSRQRAAPGRPRSA
jgi:AraC family transcriptional regulator of arabinose operon